MADGAVSDYYLEYQELKRVSKCSIRYEKGKNDNFDKIVKKGVKNRKKPDLEIYQNNFD